MPRALALIAILLLGAVPWGSPPAAVADGSGVVVAMPAVVAPTSGFVAATPGMAAAAPGIMAPFAARAGSWLWPVPAPHPLARPYVAPPTPYAAGHRGIDILAGGTEVFAPAAGVVSFAGVVVDRPVLSIRHPGGIVTSYEPVESALSAGDAVSAGQLIGALLPGHCASSCLHFGVRVDGQYVSPLAFLGGIPPSILLPTRGS